MLVSTKAIVLSKLKYKDHDLIVKCYTEKFGVKSYLLRNILKSKKGKFKPAYFQLLTLLEIQADHKNNRISDENLLIMVERFSKFKEFSCFDRFPYVFH